MTLIIELFIALICHGGVCHVDRIFISRDDLAKAVLGSEMHYLDLMKPEDRV